MRSSRILWILAGGCGSPLSFQAARIRGLPNESAYSDREMRGRARLRFFKLAFFQTRICVPFRTRTLEPNVIRLRGARGRDRG